MAVGVLGAGLHHLAARERGALGDRHHRVVAGVRRLVAHQLLGQTIDVERHLGDDRALDSGQVGRHEGGLAAVAAEHLDHGEALVRARARAQLVHEDHRARHGGREPDAVVGAVHVVVHRLRDRDDGHAFLVQPQRERERVVAADRDQRVDAEMLDDPQHVRRCGRAARRRCGPSARNAGSSAVLTLAGFVREVCRNVPPVRSIVRTTPGSSGKGVRGDGLEVVGIGVEQAAPARAGCRRPRDPPTPRGSRRP